MANHISHASLPYPIRNARFSLLVPYLDSDGDPTDPTTPDTEISEDAGAFTDTAEEVTTISGSNGMGYLTLTGAETDCSMLALAAKVASGPKHTLMAFYPRNLPVLAGGTASAGAAGSITLASAIAYDITGCFVRTTGGTGGGGSGGANNQARRITAYNPTTQVATVSPNWETTPDNTTTYDILCPEGVTPGMIRALNVTDTYVQPGQAAPPATTTLPVMLAFLFKAWRNKKDQSSSVYRLYADDGTTVDQKATVSDSAGLTTVAEIGTGP